MDPLNIFYHSPKELTTDAFWVWLLYFLDSSEKYEEAKQYLFDDLILREEDKGRRVGHISAKTQEKCSHGRVDFYFTFTFLDDGSKHLVLFEDKTWSSTSKSQLNGYKKAFPAAYRFFYYKLAYIGIHERELVKKCGYDIITARMMETCLSRFCGEHLLIRDYRNYIKDTFADYIDSFPPRLFDEKEYDLLEDAQVQLFLADSLLDAIPNWEERGMYNYFGTSAGRPWTEISLVEESPIMLGYDESIFWRIDIRMGRFYIRLNQYARYESDLVRDKKQKRLARMREISEELLSGETFSLKKGDPSNKVGYEQEIVIFFLPENDWEIIFKDIPRFTDAFLEKYDKELPPGFPQA